MDSLCCRYRSTGAALRLAMCALVLFLLAPALAAGGGMTGPGLATAPADTLLLAAPADTLLLAAPADTFLLTAPADTLLLTAPADTLPFLSRPAAPGAARSVRHPFELGLRIGPAFGDGEVSTAKKVSIDRSIGYVLGMSLAYSPVPRLGIRATYLHYFYDVAYASVLEERGGDLRVVSFQLELVLTFREESEGPFYVSAGVARADFGADVDAVDTNLRTVGGFVLGAGTNLYVARSERSAMSIHVGLSVLVTESPDEANGVTWQGQLPVLLLGASYHF